MLTTTGGVILFSWLVCESIILVFMVWIWNVRIAASGSIWKSGLILAAMLAAMFCVTFFDVSSQALRQPNDANWTLAYQLTVDAYCTLYVLLEALITTYAVFLFLSGQYLIGSNDRVAHWNLHKDRLNFQLEQAIRTIGLVVVIFYVGYHYVYIDLVHAGRLEDRYVYTGFHFYYVVCGFLWVLINGVAAFFAYRIFRLIQHNKAYIYVGSA